MPTTYALIPGAGGDAWEWHRVAPLLSVGGGRAIAVDLPADDDTADLSTNEDTVCDAVANASGLLVLVAQSMGRSWWEATGQKQAMRAYFEQIGLDRNEFDVVGDFFHDVPEPLRTEALSQPEPRQSDTPFEQPWPLDRWPDIPTRVVAGSDDRLFPLEFQRRVVRERLGLDVEVIPGGHLAALSQPEALAERILASAQRV